MFKNLEALDFKELVVTYAKGLAIFVKFEKDTGSVADEVTELVMEGEMSLEDAVNFPETLMVSLAIMANILERDLEKDIAMVEEKYEKVYEKQAE
ncbi:MAG: hypothetical protein U0L26_12580 [Cellulosilyticum sp.]|nr:hypothetical protein [Cellulosilyticum sp.]